eukprot:TRINITY_DN3007_c0_g1_i1.p1 TRINITY_DN3007_c0_g1~~TRINITY_DN3007_c0_g1_i1.p1  ORF type:complete len:439 (+),score=138.04 TRINITY_DN3007_c0_g1_i1:117-1433(+)
MASPATRLFTRSGLWNVCHQTVSRTKLAPITAFGLCRKVSSQPASCYPGEKSEFRTEFKFLQANTTIPTYRIMDESGTLLAPEQLPPIDKATLIRMYECMLTLNSMDVVLYDVQRQGRISFYMTSFGEEATHVGSAAALRMEDVIYAQYREAGVLLWRGFTLDEFVNQCYSSARDYGKGRQMPVHYGARHLNFQTISSPLATQIPQAAGAAYAMKLAGSEACVMCYFGEGAASEGDFHAALNFAAVLDTPTIFFCRNNRWAISTPSSEQYRGDGIAARALAYGIRTMRVDGNDMLAVYNATAAARAWAVEHKQPVCIEAMTYRVGHHSTSDDSSRYRPMTEVDDWRQKFSPITRMYNYLVGKGWWSAEQEAALRKQARTDVLAALGRAENEKKPAISELFNDVYDQLTPQLIAQQKQLQEHLARYPDKYPLDTFARDA